LALAGCTGRIPLTGQVRNSPQNSITFDFKPRQARLRFNQGIGGDVEFRYHKASDLDLICGREQFGVQQFCSLLFLS